MAGWPTDVARKAKFHCFFPFGNGQRHIGAAKYMPCIPKLYLDARANLEFPAIAETGKTPHGLRHVHFAVKRLPLFPVVLTVLVVELGIPLLYERTVQQHDGAEASGGVGAENRALKAVLHQFWQSAAVVNMCM